MCGARVERDEQILFGVTNHRSGESRPDGSIIYRVRVPCRLKACLKNHPMANLCEHFNHLDLAWLRRPKMLTPGASSSVNWTTGGRPSGSIRIEVRMGTMRFIYRVLPFGRAWSFAAPLLPVLVPYVVNCNGFEPLGLGFNLTV
jgi:hypothetical protein